MLAALALALVAAAQPGLAVPDRSATLTRAQVRTMRPEDLTRRLFGALGRIMFLQSDRAGRGDGPLRALSFLTRPHRTDLAGICQTEMFFVGFEPALASAGEDPPVSPARVQILDNSYFVANVALARGGALTEDAETHGRDCRDIDPRTVTIVVANSEGAVDDAVQLFADLLDGARAGRVAAALDCRDQGGAALGEPACLAMLAHYRADRMHVVGIVPGCGRGATDVWCERIETSLDDMSGHMEIVFETPRGDRPDIPPARIRVAPVPPDTSYQEQ